METLSLKDKTIVIVGGTSGLGLSASRACVDAGAAVVAVGLDDDHAKKASAVLGSRGTVIRADARHPETVRKAIETAIESYGDFDGLYHVAGGGGRHWGDGALHEVTDDAWEKTVALNQSSVFYSNRAAVLAFRTLGHGGSILNLASVLAFSPSPRHFGTYSYAAAKGAIIAMTLSAAAAYAGENIRVNALAPGLVDTPMSDRALGDSTIMEYVKRKQPLDGGRPAEVSDLDGAVLFFLSSASSFVTGQVLSVDGGWSVTDASVDGPNS